MTPRSTWLSFTVVSTLILLAAGFLGATVWRQDAREQRAGVDALWEQKVQGALWRMDAAASAMVAREAARRPEEFAALAKGGSALADPQLQGRLKPTLPPGSAGLQARSEDLKEDKVQAKNSGPASPRSQDSRAGSAPAPGVQAAQAAQAEPVQEQSKNRYFSEKIAFAKSKGAAQAAQAEARPDAAEDRRHEPAAPAAPLADLARRLPAPASAPAPSAAESAPFIAPVDRAGNYGYSNAEAQIQAQVDNSFSQRKAAQQAIVLNLQSDQGQALGGENANATTRDTAAVNPLTVLVQDNALILARRIGAPGYECVQGVRFDTAAVADELLALVRSDFPQGQLLPEYASPPPNLARTLAALPLRFEPNDAPVFNAVWTPTRFAVSSAGATLLIALGAVALLLARTLALSERRAAFVSTMTHELRTPLTTFRLYTDLLEAAPETTDRARYTAVLAREAERLSHLVENVLSYARLERGRGKPVPKAQTVDELLAPALERLRERAERAGFMLEVAPHDGTATVRADCATVEQILLNLVDNAGKYAVTAQDRRLILSVEETPNFRSRALSASSGEKQHPHPASGGLFFPELALRARERTLCISLRDFGPGLDPVMQKRLFTPFSRSDKEAAGNAPGVGLGLALCRRLAREMGGDLVYRKAEPGAEFALCLM